MRSAVQIRFQADYPLGAPDAAHRLRLTPRATASQTVLSAQLRLDPEPDACVERDDFFGNRPLFLSISGRHTRLQAEVRAEVQTRPPLDKGSGATVGELSGLALAHRGLEADAPGLYLFESPRLAIAPALTAYAEAELAPDRPVFEAALALARRIHADFAYDPHATHVATDPTEALAQRRGVCQDFAQIMIAGLRGAGVPAGYVSGVIRTHPAPGTARLEGADAMHAWVRVWGGPDAGWAEFDPTNAMAAGEEHVVVAYGRDYADAAPIDGVIVTAGDQSSRLVVDMRPLEEAP